QPTLRPHSSPPLAVTVCRRRLASFLSFFQCYGAHRALHSFPTRRSSDLTGAAGQHCFGASDTLNLPDSGGGAAAVSCTADPAKRSEEHTSELQSQSNLVCRLLLEKKKKKKKLTNITGVHDSVHSHTEQRL